MNVNALVCEKPGSLAVEKRPVLAAGPGDALVRPLRIGICGTDYHIFEGKHPFLEYPRVMGHELAVEVLETAVGSGFECGDVCVVNPYKSCGTCIACRAGRPNCCTGISVLGVHEDGGMTDRFVLPAKQLIKAPGLSADACAIVEFLAIGAHAVRRGEVGEGAGVLVVGAGPIGLGVALFARLAGAKVSLVDTDAARAAETASITGVAALATPDTGGAGWPDDGFDIVFDATGNRVAMEAGFAHVAHGGTYVLVGLVNDRIGFSDPDFHRKEMTLRGSRNALACDFERVIEALRAREVEVERIVTHRTTLEGAVTDLANWASAKAGLIKAVIETG
jgi:2-desacetyl-2-hydroxyethyl bacteriochlorophyllide A dehydrogenase